MRELNLKICTLGFGNAILNLIILDLWNKKINKYQIINIYFNTTYVHKINETFKYVSKNINIIIKNENNLNIYNNIQTIREFMRDNYWKNIHGIIGEKINNNINHYNQLIFPLRDIQINNNIFTKNKIKIFPINESLKIINELKQKNKDYISIHIRETDFITSTIKLQYQEIKKKNIIINYDKYFQFIDKYPNKKIYLATDNSNTQQIFINKYKDRIIYFEEIKENGYKHQVRYTTNFSIIIDFFMCVSSHDFLGTYKSTFSTLINTLRFFNKQSSAIQLSYTAYVRRTEKARNYDFFKTIQYQKQIVILVIMSRNEIYDQIIKNYWTNLLQYIKSNHPNIRIFFTIGYDVEIDDLPKIIKDNVIISDKRETYTPGILYKTIYSLNYIHNYVNYDFLFRTNLSSFLYIKNMLKYIEKLPSKKCYIGSILTLGENDQYQKFIPDVKNLQYLSGAGIFLSPDVIQIILDNEKNLNYNLIDDVAIGHILKDKIKFTNLKYTRFSIVRNSKNLNEQQLKDNLNKILNSSQFHIRIANKKNRKVDIPIFDYFTKNIYNSN